MNYRAQIPLTLATFLLAVSLLPLESVDASLVWLPQYITRKDAPSYYLGRRGQIVPDKRGWGFSSITDAANKALNSASDLVPGSLDDAKNMASDLGNSALEKGSQLAAENGIPTTSQELQSLAAQNGVPLSVEEAQALAAVNGLPTNTAELEALAREQGLPTDPTGLQQLAADQGFDLNQYGAMLGDIDKQGLASAAGQIAGQMAGGGSGVGTTLLSMEILDKLSEVKTLIRSVEERCGEAPAAEIVEGERSEISGSEADKRGFFVRQMTGKRGDLVRAFGKRGDLVRGFGKRSDPTADLIGLGAQMVPTLLNPMGALTGGKGADTGNLFTILAELNEVILQLKKLV